MEGSRNLSRESWESPATPLLLAGEDVKVDWYGLSLVIYRLEASLSAMRVVSGSLYLGVQRNT